MTSQKKKKVVENSIFISTKKGQEFSLDLMKNVKRLQDSNWFCFERNHCAAWHITCNLQVESGNSEIILFKSIVYGLVGNL